MNGSKFSIVIPTHNGEAYIAETIKSVLNQTFQFFQIIILEHQSTDRTLEIARSFNDTRINICSTSQPQTIESNWGRILDLELAEYLTILGHDDILYPEFLQEIFDLIHKEPNASLYLTHFHIIASDGSIIRLCKPIPYRETGEGFMRARQNFQRDSFGTGYVMRSIDYKRIGGFSPFSRLFYADDFTFYRLANISVKVCSASYAFAYRYHRRSEAYVSNLETLAEATEQFITALKITPYAEDPNNITLAYDYVYKTFTRRYIRLLITLIQTENITEWHHYIKIRKNFLLHFPRQKFSMYDLLVFIIEPIFSLHNYWNHKPISNLIKYVGKFLARTKG